MKSQIVGNVGLYRVCAELSGLGFNVMPTARNARGADVVGYDDNGHAFTVQVKTLTKRNAIRLAEGRDLIADYLVVVVLEGKWAGQYVWTREEIRKANISAYGPEEKKQFWYQSTNWTKKATSAHDAWKKIRPSPLRRGTKQSRA